MREIQIKLSKKDLGYIVPAMNAPPPRGLESGSQPSFADGTGGFAETTCAAMRCSDALQVNGKTVKAEQRLAKNGTSKTWLAFAKVYSRAKPVTTTPVSSINMECQEWDAWHSMMISDFDGEEELVYDDDFCPPPSLVLVVTASSEKGYVTVHDYITQMWPWLFKHRYMIIKSEGPDEVEQLLETEWVIDMGGVRSVILCEKERWPEVQKNAAARIMREREGKKLPGE